MTGPDRLGRCLNAGSCGLAGQRGPIPIAADADFRCPECKSDLIPFDRAPRKVDTGAKGKRAPLLLIVPAVLLTLLVIIGVRYGLFGSFDLRNIPPASAGDTGKLIVTPGSAATGASTVAYDVLAPLLWQGFLSDQGCGGVTRSVTETQTTLACATGTGPRITIAAPSSTVGMARKAAQAFDILITADASHPQATASNSIAVPDADGKTVRADVIGIDALVVIVNPSNPLARLSQVQLAGIFLGRITDYSAVGGNPGAIDVVAPTGNPLANERLNAVVPQWLPITLRARRLASSQAIVAAVLANPAAIGIVEIGASSAARVVPIGPANGIAVAPTPLALISGDYPLARPVMAVRFDPDDRSYAGEFIAFTHSATAQGIIALAGFEPVRPVPFDAPVPAAAPVAYRTLVTGAKRIAANLRFRAGSIDLEPRSKADLDAVAARLVGDRVDPARIIVIGLADPAQPDAAADSARLARHVATSLGERGVAAPPSRGLGGIMPVAEPVQAGRNRRVEIWLTAAKRVTKPKGQQGNNRP
jgi:phosphate transport system substrate-binding protein